MKWIQACLKNKLIIYLLAIMLCVGGIFALFKMSISPFPSISGNTISVTLNYPGANAQSVQQQVTQEVVARLQGIDNIHYIKATSQNGQATISLMLNDFSKESTLEAQMKILQAISSANLPSSVPQANINISGGTSTLIAFAVSSSNLSLFDINNLIQGILIPKLSSLPGVSIQSTKMSPIIKIELSPAKLAQYQLSPQEVFQLINQSYQASPLGNIQIQDKSYTLGLSNQIIKLTDFNHIIIGYQQTNSNIKGAPLLPIYLSEVATIRFEPRELNTNTVSTFNGKTSDDISLYTSTSADPFTISSISTTFVDSIAHKLNNKITITPVFDMSSVMSQSMYEVSFTILIAAILVLLVALIFLGQFKLTLVPIITIPVCLLGALLLVALMGVSLNIMTLLALVVAVGLVVDDAIVVVENITRLMEQGVKSHHAVIKGSSEIALTIIGITLTLLAVYLPLVFLSGPIAEMLKPFALTLALAVFISGIVALTLTPIMASALLKRDYRQNRYQHWFEQQLKSVVNIYHIVLDFMLGFPKLFLFIFACLITAAGFYALKLPKTVYQDDPSGRLNITVNGNTQDSAQSLQQQLKVFEPFYTAPYVQYYSATISPDENTGLLTAKVQIQTKPEYLAQNLKIAEEINAFIANHHIENAYAKISPFLNWGDDYEVNFEIYGENIKTLTDNAKTIQSQLVSSPIFAQVIADLNEPKMQFQVNIDEQKAASVGILKPQITAVLSNLYGGATLNNYFHIKGLSVPIVVRLNDKDLMNPESLKDLNIQSPLTHQTYPLSEFVNFTLTAKPDKITTFNNQQAIQILARLNKGYNVSDALAFVNQVIAKEAPTLQYQYIGSSEQYLQSNDDSLWIAIFAILSIYFLLIVLFKNFIDPFIILLCVPFSIVGGMLSLYLIDGSLNLFSMLGLITLIGLITKHGVLIIQFANNELKKGVDLKSAIEYATEHRFRPIMMTTFAMVFGALPLILSDKMLYVSRENLGIVLIGGLLIGTIFSLFIIPLMFMLIKKVEQHME
ncbi:MULTISPECIES: efflux RND transporter permease subunit [Cysteiniphilum]|uniref:Multidrug transporter AcrB n=1 Tax=Cysteiniphilum litorale TaxID=2056700 RepID=A0A8J2Z2R5_9GAMM|nr:MULTISPECIES: efflux RND transporter permease subunit [Cysteiniphilum]GGF88216.1 multidrug transporter AcrB [Cysteiniphilum litorale]